MGIMKSPHGGEATSIWIMGLSASGKSTLSRRLVARLRAGGVACMLLDGDQIRQVFDERLGYDAPSRRQQTERVLKLARLIAGQGIIPVIAIIHPFEDDRVRCREALPNAFQVHLDCGIDHCRRRDLKGVYGPGAVNVVGLDIPFDPPASADLVLDSGRLTPDALLERLWPALETVMTVPVAVSR